MDKSSNVVGGLCNSALRGMERAFLKEGLYNVRLDDFTLEDSKIHHVRITWEPSEQTSLVVVDINRINKQYHLLY